MGYGSWSKESFKSYSTSMGRSVDSSGSVASDYSAQDMFQARTIDPMLDPKGVMRESCDSEEHPNSIPVILALDVTGSMGQTAVEVAKQLNIIMTKLYSKIADVQFMIMGIGDFAYDRCPLQVSQFESDIRIAEQLDKIYFEAGGGGNRYESYTSAWYFASRHTKLDCWNRGKKGILITIGDEMLNPYIPKIGRNEFSEVTGDEVQGDIETNDLYKEVSEKYLLYHVDVNHRYRNNDEEIMESFQTCIGENNFFRVSLNEVTDTITEIIINASKSNENVTDKNSWIAW